jgi:GxxExxY protein
MILACFEVYNEMGTGFIEPVYQECLDLELHDREIPFEPQSSLAPPLPVRSIPGHNRSNQRFLLLIWY